MITCGNSGCEAVASALPNDFLAEVAKLPAAYLRHSDPIRQSGFGGGAERWRAEREPILDGVNRSGTFIDIGCANGYLLECLVKWGRDRGLELEPFGLDISPDLIALANARFPGREDHFYIANAWDWIPPRRFDFVYTLYDNVPPTHLADYLRQLLANVVAPGGRLIIGAYGSRTRNQPAFDVAEFIAQMQLEVAGSGSVGRVPEARFAWTDNQLTSLDQLSSVSPSTHTTSLKHEPRCRYGLTDSYRSRPSHFPLCHFPNESW
jgi:SAM-dependent methyltransferase